MDPETEVRYDRHSLMGHETAQDRYNPNCTGRIMICICVCTYMCMFEYLYIYISYIYVFICIPKNNGLIPDVWMDRFYSDGIGKRRANNQVRYYRHILLNAWFLTCVTTGGRNGRGASSTELRTPYGAASGMTKGDEVGPWVLLFYCCCMHGGFDMVSCGLIGVVWDNSGIAMDIHPCYD